MFSFGRDKDFKRMFDLNIDLGIKFEGLFRFFAIGKMLSHYTRKVSGTLTRYAENNI